MKQRKELIIPGDRPKSRAKAALCPKDHNLPLVVLEPFYTRGHAYEEQDGRQKMVYDPLNDTIQTKKNH